MSRIVVVGAGIAGLASAALLARDGHDVTVLERGDHVGGRVATWHEDGFAFDLGPSWYLMPEVFERFFAALGTSVDAELDLRPLPIAYRVFGEDGATFDITDEPAANRAVFEQRDPGSGARLDDYLASASETYRLSLERFLYTDFRGDAGLVGGLRELVRGLGPRRLARLARLATTSLWGWTGRATDDRLLRQVLAYPAVFLGTSPFQAPALYHLMSHLDLVEGVSYPMGGFSTITDAIARLAVEAGATIRTGVEVESILVDPAGGGAGRRSERGVVRGVLARDRADASSVPYEVVADVVVAAGDLHHTETQLVEPRFQTYPESWWEHRDPGPGAVLLCLGVRGQVDALAHHSLFFTRDWAENFAAVFGPDHRVPDPASVYVCRPSATDPGVAPEGHENLFVLVPVPPDVTLTEDDSRVRALADRVVRQIERWAGVPFLAERIVVQHVLTPASFHETLHAWSGGALGPAHTLRQSAMFRGRSASARVDGLVYAGGSTVPGVGLPMCLISAELAAQNVRRLVGEPGVTGRAAADRGAA